MVRNGPQHRSSHQSRSPSHSPMSHSQHLSSRHASDRQSSPIHSRERYQTDPRTTQSSPARIDPKDSRIKELEREILSLQNFTQPNTDKKRKRNETSTMKRKGRVIPRVCTVYEDVHTVLAQHDKYRRNGYHKPPEPEDSDEDELDELGDEERDCQKKEKEERYRLKRGYMGVLELNKVIPDIVKLINNDTTIVEELQAGASSARTHDTSEAMHFVGHQLNKRVQKINDEKTTQYQQALRVHAQKAVECGKKYEQELLAWEANQQTMSHDDGPETLTPRPMEPPSQPEPLLHLLPVFNEKTREERGLQNDLTGLLLCPVQFDWNNTEIRASVRALSTDYDFSSFSNARCFYRHEQFDSEDYDKGYLQSHLLIQLYRHLFTSPSSAKDQPDEVENMPINKKKKLTSNRSSVSQLCQISEVTGRSIAYAAVHLHLALSNADQWTASHEGYNYQNLWEYVVDFFEAPADDEVHKKRRKELLKWWNDRIFAGTKSASNCRGNKMLSRAEYIAKRLQKQVQPPLAPVSQPSG
ncbi:hypothetical protein D9757_000389 [Collybiopsis confluens]|uniref:Uncharacterized protein n=1 Tax=Collybiopsis confluens TaxID=2823264 RepID=A0A8H5I289_9AGAR|nr:hypothetical protein D9757_000389 [Collybiopsis confluens]